MEKSVALFFCQKHIKNIAKKYKKLFKNLLTNEKRCVIIRVQGKGNTQTKKGYKAMKKEIAYKTPYGYFYNGKPIEKKVCWVGKAMKYYFVDEKSFSTLKEAKQYIDSIAK